jgi:CSLREA domain-containing protein
MRPLSPSLLALLLAAATVHAATITVNSNADNTTVDGNCTLREAIIAANTNATTGDCTKGDLGLDTIQFSIGSGAQTIGVLTTPLPGITEPLTINGTTQPGFAGAPIIEINGSGVAGAASGLTIAQTASGSTIRSLVIDNFSFLGINVLSSNNLIAGNYIETNGSGGIGLNGFPGGTNNTIGGTAAGDANLISGNTGNGITILDSGSDIVVGNVIGLNAAKTAALANTGHGVDVFASGNRVGGTAAGEGNVIAGNTLSGVHINAGNNNLVQGNQIGLIISGSPVGNQQAGVFIEVAGNNNTIGAATSGGAGGNSIFGNGASSTVSAGVRVLAGTGNRISTNSMSFNSGSNAAMAIDLGNDGSTPNDNCDGDAGPNNLQNFPVIDDAVVAGGTTTVIGSLNSTASSTFVIELFSNPPATFDQGVNFLGSTTVTTSAGCTVSFAVPLAGAVPTTPVPFTVTATATDGVNNTSEMSAAVFVAPALTASKQFTPPTIVNGAGSTLTVSIANPGPGSVAALQFTDTYPVGMVNAAGSTSNTCGGTLTATAGAGSFTLSGVALASGASCQVTVPVTTTGPGAFPNTLPVGAISATYTPTLGPPTSTTNATDAAATLNVNPLTAPTVTKAFAPQQQGGHQPVHMTITLSNSNAVAITGVGFTDALPAGMTLAPAVNPSNTCGGTLTATSGASSVVLSGGTIPASGNCTVTVDVVATANGTLTNTIPASAVTSANAPPNSAPASASLQSVNDIPAIAPSALAALLAMMAAIALLRLRA